MTVDTEAQPALESLPSLNESNVKGNASKDNTPFPRKTAVLEHLSVETGNVNQREDSEESHHYRPEQELVVVNSLEDGKGASPALIHVKQTAVEVLHFPRGYKEKKAERGKDSGTRLVDKIAV